MQEDSYIGDRHSFKQTLQIEMTSPLSSASPALECQDFPSLHLVWRNGGPCECAHYWVGWFWKIVGCTENRKWKGGAVAMRCMVAQWLVTPSLFPSSNLWYNCKMYVHCRACTLRGLRRELVWIICHHHVLEIVFCSVFKLPKVKCCMTIDWKSSISSSCFPTSSWLSRSHRCKQTMPCSSLSQFSAWHCGWGRNCMTWRSSLSQHQFDLVIKELFGTRSLTLFFTLIYLWF